MAIMLTILAKKIRMTTTQKMTGISSVSDETADPQTTQPLRLKYQSPEPGQVEMLLFCPSQARRQGRDAVCDRGGASSDCLTLRTGRGNCWEVSF